jgi:AbrB family looped-hinge helix DNA binding protein
LKSFSVRIGDRGRLVLPAQVRRRLDLHSGDRLILQMEPDGSVRMTSAAELARRFQGAFAAEEPERSLVDELIAERREEARREEAEL